MILFLVVFNLIFLWCSGTSRAEKVSIWTVVQSGRVGYIRNRWR